MAPVGGGIVCEAASQRLECSGLQDSLAGTKNSGGIAGEEPSSKRQKLEDDTGDDELIIANGWEIDENATPETLHDQDRSRFALSPDDSYRSVDLTDKRLHHLVPGGEAWTDKSDALSMWAVCATPMLMNPAECEQWIHRAEEEALETGDFIFKTGRNGYERMKTGARRHSATRLIQEEGFAKIMEDRLRGMVPLALADGRRFQGVKPSFLLTRYVAGQYFAPHFDGCMKDFNTGWLSAFVAVLYLNDDFEGGATHYLPGQGSEVGQAIAVRPCRGCAVVHRGVSVLHCGGRVLSGTKYIMQFSLMYEAPHGDAGRDLTQPLRWGA